MDMFLLIVFVGICNSSKCCNSCRFALPGFYQATPGTSLSDSHGGTPIVGCFLLGKIPSFEMDDDLGVAL